MKVAALEDNNIVIEEKNLPHLPDEGAMVKVLGCGLCGSDIVKYREHLVKNGTVLGHEIVGEIVDIKSSTKFKVGDKIVSSHHIPCFKCDYCKNGNYSMCEHFKATNIVPGGFSEYIYLSEEHLKNVAVKIPKNLTEIEASFYEPLACCIRAVERGEENYGGKKALIIGLGSIGLLMGQAVKSYGADTYGCDLLEERINLANSLGIKSCQSKDTDGMKADIVFMTSGADATIDVALKAVRNGGKIVVFSSTPKNFGYANNEIYYRELTVLGSYSPSPDNLRTSMKLLKSKQVNVKNLSTVYEIDNIAEAFHDTIDNKILKAYIKIG